MLMMVRVVAGKHAEAVGVKLAMTDKTLTFLSFSSFEVVRVPRRAVRQMIMRTSQPDPDFTKEPTDSELRTLWRFVQSKYDPTTHTIIRHREPTDHEPQPPPIAVLRKMYREQPPLTKNIRGVSCCYII